jgi:hypothetical protein
MATQLFSNNFHPKKPNMDITLSYDVSRPGGEQSKGLQYTFYGSLYCKSGEYYYASNAVGVQITVDGITKTFYLRGIGGGSTGEGSSVAGPWTQTECIPSDGSYSQTADYPTSFSFSTENIGSTAGISVYVWCHQGTYAEPRGGLNCTASGGPYDYTYTGTIGVPAYNPYTEPSVYAITSYTKIGRAPVNGHAGTDYSVTYNIQCGAGGAIHWARCELYQEGTTWNYGKYANVEGAISGKCVYTDYVLQPNDNMYSNGERTTTIKLPAVDHKKYKIAIRFSDCHHQWISGDDKNIYTYTPPQDPNVQLNLNGDKYTTISNVKTISPQDGASVSFKIGSRGWNDDTIEKSFTTEFKCNSYVNNDYKIANVGNTIQTTTHTVNLNATNLNNMLTVAERSTARVSTTVYVKNLNPSANWSDDGSVTFNVQYQPRIAPTEGDVKYGGTSYKGQTVIATNVPKITVNWSYDSSGGAAGVVNGYLYTVYADSSKNKVMKTDRISGTSVDINTSELNLGTLNYIVITPYYTKADGTGYIDGSLSVGFNLIKPLNKLLKPEIEYPQKDYSIDAKTTTAYWHNKNFRVCFISSQDPDLDNIIAKEKITPETYEYNNIQVKINNNVYSYNDYPDMFSRNKTGHLHHFVINPSLISSFANATLEEYYNIQVRFQKKYFADLNSEDSWSDWSNQIRITMHSLPVQTFTAGQVIEAVHLDNIKQHIIHAYNAYSSSNASYSATQVGQSIAHATFKTYYDYIQAIKTTVNSYGAFTRDSVKFDKDNKIDTIDAFKKEFITANKEVTYADESTGSNYFKLLEESLKNLK